MAARPLIVVNPAAANGRTARRWPAAAAALRSAGLDFDVAITERPGQATEIVRRALERGAGTIVAVGGDGTVNEVVNGFFADGQPINPAARLGILPYGTGRDLARTLGLPGGRSVEHLLREKEILIDLGLARLRDHDGRPTERYFANVADVGIGGATAARVNRSSKAFGPVVTYLWSAVLTILKSRHRRIRLQADGGAAQDLLAAMVVVANGQYFAGGMHAAPGARLDDGQFEIIVLGPAGRLDLLFNLIPRVYRGAHLTHPLVSCFAARCLRIECDEPVPLEVDGEPIGTGPVEFAVVPGALRLLA